MKKNRLRCSMSALMVLIAAAMVFFPGGAGYCADDIFPKEKKQESLENKKEYDTIQQNRALNNNDCARLLEEHGQLIKDFQAMSADRDNLLIQTKKLVAAKNRSEEMLGMIEQIQGSLDKVAREKEELISRDQSHLLRISELEEAQKEAAASKTKLLTNNAQLTASIVSLKEQLNSGSLQAQVEDLKKSNAALTAELKQAAGEGQKNKEANGQWQKECKDLRARAENAERKYKEAVEHIRAYERKVASSPSKLVELAKQNKALIDQTATMHYNLGVFYTRQREYSRSAAEFEKTLELKPDDAQAHFNLGYIYAEHIVDRGRAVKHFQDYLKYTKKDDKDIDWVKRYLLTWQSWDGKEPMK